MNTVSRRFGISTLTSLRLFTRAPCTRIRSWLSAACSAGDCSSVLVAMLIVSPSVRRRRLRGSVGVAWLVGPGSSSRLVRLRRRIAATVRCHPIDGVVAGGATGCGGARCGNQRRRGQRTPSKSTNRVATSGGGWRARPGRCAPCSRPGRGTRSREPSPDPSAPAVPRRPRRAPSRTWRPGRGWRTRRPSSRPW